MKQIENYNGVAITFATKENSNNIMVNITGLGRKAFNEMFNI